MGIRIFMRTLGLHIFSLCLFPFQTVSYLDSIWWFGQHKPPYGEAFPVLLFGSSTSRLRSAGMSVDDMICVSGVDLNLSGTSCV